MAPAWSLIETGIWPAWCWGAGPSILQGKRDDDLRADLLRRDYRINAIALTLSTEPTLLDPSGGIADLRHQRITAVHEQNLLDDPLRLLRALRLVAELSMTIDGATLKMIERHREPIAQGGTRADSSGIAEAGSRQQRR